MMPILGKTVMEAVQFYTNPMSRGRMVHWMLEECGAPYEPHLLDFAKKEHKSAAYLEINPMGKLPAIVHRGVVVTETAAICTYLADVFPQHNLAPGVQDPARGTYYRWLFFAAGCVEPAVIDKMLGRPPAERIGAMGYGSYENTMSTLEKALEHGPYLLGETFSAADVYVASQIGFGVRMKALEPSEVLRTYAERCTQRPAFLRAQEIAATWTEKLKT